MYGYTEHYKSIFTAHGCDIKTLTSFGLTNQAGQKCVDNLTTERIASEDYFKFADDPFRNGFGVCPLSNLSFCRGLPEGRGQRWLRSKKAKLV